MAVALHRPAIGRVHALMKAVVSVVSRRHAMSASVVMRVIVVIIVHSQPEFIHDSLVPGSCLDGTEQGHDFLDQGSFLLVVRIVQGSLHNIIGELVIDHLGHGTGTDHLLDHEASIIRAADANALQLEMMFLWGRYLFDDVGAKLCLGQLHDMILELVDEWRQIRIGPIEDVLKDIIPKLVLRKRDGVFDEDLVELFGLLITRMIDTTLEDTTAVLMGGHLETMHSNSIKDELQVSRGTRV